VLKGELGIDELLLEVVGSETNVSELLLAIQQLLWKEVEFEVFAEEHELGSALICAICLYHNNKLDITDVRVILNLFYTANRLSKRDLVRCAYLTLLKTYSKPIDSITFFKAHMRDFGVNSFDFIEVKTIADELGEDTSSYEFVETKYQSVVQRPEYFQDIIENSDNDDLEELQHWVDADQRSLITDLLLSRRVKIESKSYEDTLQSFEEDTYLQQFPLSHDVLGDKIAGFEPRTIDMMTELADIPQSLTMNWLPRFVYSKPELEENVRIYYPGGPHIGHSAIVVKSNFGSFMMDFGMSVVNTSSSRWLPLMDKLDFVLISHAHMDHSGSLPLLYGSERKLPWFGHAHTRVMTEMLWGDTRRLTWGNVDHDVVEADPYLKRLVSRGSILNALNNFHDFKVGETKRLLPSIKVTSHDASHLFGSLGFDIEIGGKRILYTGDCNIDKGATFPTDADITLFDSTYFERYDTYDPAEVGLKAALESSDRILIPAFSMGRSQEILFELKKLGAEKDWTIYLTGMGGKLASKLNITVGRSPTKGSGGTIIAPTVKPEEFVEKSIVIAGQGMLQAGTSRWLFDDTKEDDRTSVILCGYQAPNTLGYHLLQNHNHLLGRYQQQIRRVKMSGHTSGGELDKFMDNLSNRKVMVHAPEGAYQNKERQDVEAPQKFDHMTI
jgi:Cft2 family RNA processing exonuclease